MRAHGCCLHLGALFSSDVVRLPRRRRPTPLPRRRRHAPLPRTRAPHLHASPHTHAPSRAPALGFPEERRRHRRARNLQPLAVPHPAPGVPSPHADDASSVVDGHLQPVRVAGTSSPASTSPRHISIYKDGRCSLSSPFLSLFSIACIQGRLQ